MDTNRVLEVRKDTNEVASCHACNAMNYDASISGLGRRVDTLYEVRIGGWRMSLCAECLQALRDKVPTALADKTPTWMNAPFAIGEEVFIVEPNSHQFRLEVVPVKVVSMSETEVVVERRMTSLTATRWTYPMHSAVEHIYKDRASAEAALPKED